MKRGDTLAITVEEGKPLRKVFYLGSVIDMSNVEMYVMQSRGGEFFMKTAESFQKPEKKMIPLSDGGKH